MQTASGVDTDDLEQEPCRVAEIIAARVVAGADRRISEVQFLSLPHKHAKQVVPDVQSVATATSGPNLDRRIVSAVQCTARVVLTRGDWRVTGTAEGLVATSSVLRPVAQATYEEVVSGSAVIRLAGEFDAVARSVLDATNRRLSQLR